MLRLDTKWEEAEGRRCCEDLRPRRMTSSYIWICFLCIGGNSGHIISSRLWIVPSIALMVMKLIGYGSLLYIVVVPMKS